MQPSVAIILINWNSLAVTHNCIASLKGIQYSNYSIIVVDNASADGSGKALKELFPEIVLLESEKNLGFAGGNNLGFDYALKNEFSYTLMLNNDTIVEPDFLTHLINHIDTHPEIGAIQPRIHYDHNRQLLWNGGSYYSKIWGIFYSKSFNKLPPPNCLTLKEVDWITGCAFLIRSDVLKKAGLLSEQMFMYYEDVDLSLRIKALGYSLAYHGKSLIYHIAGYSSKSKTEGNEGFLNPLVHYYNVRNKIWVLKKYTPWYCILTTVLYNFIYLCGVMGYFLVRRRFTKLRTVFNALIDGLKGQINYLRDNESN